MKINKEGKYVSVCKVCGHERVYPNTMTAALYGDAPCQKCKGEVE